MARGDENQRRKSKVPRVTIAYKSSHDDNTDDDDEYNEAEDQKPAASAVVLPLIPPSNKSNKSIKKRKINIRENESNYETIPTDELPSKEDIENNLLGFCCSKNCYCSKKQKEWIDNDGRDDYITADCMNSLWHRRCCHRVYDYEKDWLSPIEDVSTKIEDSLFDESKNDIINDGVFLCNGKYLNIVQRYKTAKTNEAELHNEDNEAGMFYIVFGTFIFYSFISQVIVICCLLFLSLFCRSFFYKINMSPI